MNIGTGPLAEAASETESTDTAAAGATAGDEGVFGDKDAKPSPVEQTSASLEARLQESEDLRREERVLWCIVVLIVIDAYIFQHIDNLFGPLGILALEFIFLVIFAKRNGIQEIQVLLDKILHHVGSNKQ
jgi:hypothetical protein